MRSLRCSVILGVGLLGGCYVVDRPYYELTVPGGSTTGENPSGSVLQIPIAEEIRLDVRALCYAVPGPDMSEGDSCDVWIYAFGARADGLTFTDLQFTADVIDPQGAQITAHAIDPDFGEPPADYGRRTWPARAMVDLEYEDPPRQFILNLPRITVDSETYQAPAVTFTYQSSIEVVPVWRANGL